VVGFVLLTYVLMLWIHRAIPVEVRRQHNEVTKTHRCNNSPVSHCGAFLYLLSECNDLHSPNWVTQWLHESQKGQRVTG
jgi:hypothetical protein